MQPLYDLNLQQLEDVHLVGSWRIVSRYVGQPDPATVLAEADRLQFENPDRVAVLTRKADPIAASVTFAEASNSSKTSCMMAQQEVGRWSLQRDPLLRLPYLSLWLPEGEMRALITRLRRSRDGTECEMTLYFQTGTEINLQCGPDVHSFSTPSV